MIIFMYFVFFFVLQFLFYIMDNFSIIVYWVNFIDDEFGILIYEVFLWKYDMCEINSGIILVNDWLIFSSNVLEYQFVKQLLWVSLVEYGKKYIKY